MSRFAAEVKAVEGQAVKKGDTIAQLDDAIQKLTVDLKGLEAGSTAELRSAALWYEERRPGLGDEFISEISSSLDRIRDAPESYPAWPRTLAEGPLIRKATTQRFPYVIAFEKHEQHVLVLAVAHAKRRPLYWFARTNP